VLFLKGNIYSKLHFPFSSTKRNQQWKIEVNLVRKIIFGYEWRVEKSLQNSPSVIMNPKQYLMPFSYFISCLLVHMCTSAWVSEYQVLQLKFWTVSLSFSFPQFCPAKTKLRKNKELERDKEKEKNHVKLCKAEMTQSSKWSSFFGRLLQLSLSCMF